MTKSESIARRILGWKLNRWDRWYDCEKKAFIQTSNFQPEKNLDHAMIIVDKMKRLGFTYKTNGITEVRFNDVSSKGETLAQAITNAAYNVVENNSPDSDIRIWQELC